MGKVAGISFNMNPRWVGEDGLAAFLSPLREAGLDTLEFELDGFLPEWVEMQTLIGACFAAGMKLCFHAPYRDPNRIEGFSRGRREEVKALFLPALCIAQDWAEEMGAPVNVVFHGAHSTTLGRAELRQDTLEFLRWVLAVFPDIRVALENNHPPKTGELKVGETREGVLGIVEEIDHPNLGICWDLGHDYLSQGGEEVDPAWLARVIHVHVHDVDSQGIDHYPLIYGNVPYATWLPLLASARQLRVVTLELKGGLMRGWRLDEIQSALLGSLRTIRQGIG